MPYHHREGWLRKLTHTSLGVDGLLITECTRSVTVKRDLDV